MSALVYRTMTVLCELVSPLPIGTNMGLLHMFLALLSGQLLDSRGALFPALSALRLPPDAVRRAWQALSQGRWQLSSLLATWQRLLAREQRWQAHQHGGWRALAVDTTAFFRPCLHDCPTKHFHPPSGKALPAIPFGLIARVGTVASQRLALPLAVVRAKPRATHTAALHAETLRQAVARAEANDVLVVDRGLGVRALQHAQARQYVARGRCNFTAERLTAPVYAGRGRRPTHGVTVYPLARTRQGRRLPATPADRHETWTDHGETLHADWWDGLRLSDSPVHAAPFHVVVIRDPRWTEPLLLVTTLAVAAATVRALYLDRWAIEQIPLAAKQMIGAHPQWVSTPAARHRLPELALLAGHVLSYLAATAPHQPSGFWDRTPRRTPGRLRRVLHHADFQSGFTLPQRIRQKASVTAHLPKGITARVRHHALQHATAPPMTT